MQLIFLVIFTAYLTIMRNILGGFGFLIFLCGLCFKIMLWPGSTILFLAGTVFSIIYFLLPPKKKKNSSDILDAIETIENDHEIPKPRKIGDILRSIGISLILIGVFFNIQHYPFSGFILWGGVLIAGIGVFILYKP